MSPNQSTNVVSGETDSPTSAELASDELYAWLRKAQDPQTHQVNHSIARLTTAERDQVLLAVANLLASREQASCKLIDALQWEVRRHTHRPHLVEFATSELHFFGWIRGTLRTHPLMATGLLDKFLNRLPDQHLTRLVDETHKHDVDIDHRIWDIGNWLDQNWDHSKGTLLVERLTSTERGRLLGTYTQHFLLLFLEAFRDGVIPGTTAQVGALDVRVRAQRWGWFFNHPVSNSL